MALCLDILIWQAHVNSTLLWGSNPVGLEIFLQAFFQILMQQCSQLRGPILYPFLNTYIIFLYLHPLFSSILFFILFFFILRSEGSREQSCLKDFLYSKHRFNEKFYQTKDVSHFAESHNRVNLRVVHILTVKCQTTFGRTSSKGHLKHKKN